MKNRPTRLSLLILSALMVLLLRWGWPSFSGTARSTALNQALPESVGFGQKNRSVSTADEHRVSTNDLVLAPGKGPNDYAARVTAVRDAAQNANMPIEFYGKVIDQDGNPIPSVKVILSVRWTHELMPGAARDEFNRFQLTTDAQGLFTLRGTVGSLLSVVALEKDGYDPSPRGMRQSFWYWAVTPDVKYNADEHQPEVFRMWKKSGAESLIRKGIAAALLYDGSPTILDLVEGSVGTSGDLRVMLVRNPHHIVLGQRNYEWTLTIESSDGGLIASNDEQMYRAPSSGYQRQIVVQMAASDPNWSDESSFNLFVKLRGNLYGRAEVKALIGSDRTTTPFYITSFINPSGSQNLEYDSLIDIQKSTTRKP
jgi:hypothetical protein